MFIINGGYVKIYPLSLLPILFLGCIGISQMELKKQPIVFEKTSEKNYQEIYNCFISEFPGIEFTSKEIYSELGFAEVYIGVIQAGAQRHYYRVEFKRLDYRTKVTFQ